MSPGLFNLALDDTLKELADPNVREVFGFSLHPDLEKVSVLAFADDIALISKDEASLQTLINMTVFNLDAIGLKVNPKKCKLINIKNGFLEQGQILVGGQTLEFIKPGEIIKYLGVTFEDEIVLDKSTLIKNFENDLNSLTVSNLLTPDQKLNIVNQYIWSRLIISFAMYSIR